MLEIFFNSTVPQNKKGYCWIFKMLNMMLNKSWTVNKN